MSKVLVTYHSGTGCTAGVADRIGATLAANGMRVDVAPMDSDPDPRPYDAVVAGSGVRAGGWHPRARKWMSRNAAAVKGKPLAFFTVGIALAAGPEKAEEVRGYTDKMIEKTGVQPLAVGAFAGWYVPAKFSFVERRIMEVTKAPEGDHRDWKAIEAWASGLAPKLEALDDALQAGEPR